MTILQTLKEGGQQALKHLLLIFEEKKYSQLIKDKRENVSGTGLSSGMWDNLANLG